MAPENDTRQPSEAEERHRALARAGKALREVPLRPPYWRAALALRDFARTLAAAGPDVYASARTYLHTFNKRLGQRAGVRELRDLVRWLDATLDYLGGGGHSTLKRLDRLLRRYRKEKDKDMVLALAADRARLFRHRLPSSSICALLQDLRRRLALDDDAEAHVQAAFMSAKAGRRVETVEALTRLRATADVLLPDLLASVQHRL